VSQGCSLQLGTAGISAGFKFFFSFVFEIFGILQYTADSSAGILIPFGSQVNFFGGGTFSTSISISLLIFDPINGQTVGQGIALTNGFSGPYFVSISESGSTDINTSSKCFHNHSDSKQ
jgi:hypothetical protein